MLQKSVHICVNANGLCLFDGYESMETCMPAFALVISTMFITSSEVFTSGGLFKCSDLWDQGDVFIVKCHSAVHGCSTDVLFLFITSFGHIKAPLLPCWETLSLKINRNFLFLLTTYLCHRCFPLPGPLWRPRRHIKDTLNSEIERKKIDWFFFFSEHTF